MTAYAEVAAEAVAVASEANAASIFMTFLPLLMMGVLGGIVFFWIRVNKTFDDYTEQSIGGRRKVTAALFAAFLGMFGVHRFYLGYVRRGILQALSGPMLFVCAPIMGAAYMTGSAVGLLIAYACFVYVLIMSISVVVDFFCILTEVLIPIDGWPYETGRPQTVNQVPQQYVPTRSASDAAEAINKLAQLYAQGVLTEEEFTRKKAELLERM